MKSLTLILSFAAGLTFAKPGDLNCKTGKIYLKALTSPRAERINDAFVSKWQDVKKEYVASEYYFKVSASDKNNGVVSLDKNANISFDINAKELTVCEDTEIKRSLVDKLFLTRKFIQEGNYRVTCVEEKELKYFNYIERGPKI